MRQSVVPWFCLPFLLLVSFCASTAAQDTPTFGSAITPEALFAVGSRAEYYRMGLGGRIEGLLGLPGLTFLAPSAELGYAFVPLDYGQDSFGAPSNLSLVRAGLAGRACLPVGERFSIFARASAGGFLSHLSGDVPMTAPGLTLGAGAGLSVVVSSQVLVELSTAYQTYLALYDALSIGLSVTIGLAGPGNAAIPRGESVRTGPGTAPIEGYIEFSDIQLDRVFPVLYKYYDDHPIGRVTVTNTRSRTIEDVEIQFSLNRFMDAPKTSARIERLQPGDAADIEIYALFTEDILSVTEGAKIAAELTATYSTSGRPGTDTEVVTLNTHDRNALQWDDDRKIAAFVTARDEEIQRFARSYATIVEERGVDAIDRRLQLGMVLFAAMDEADCAYISDPSSPFSSRSEQTVDSVQFPRQTLGLGGGDCDDLSAAYAALLESVGVSTAFITVPGHIYSAFRLDMSHMEAMRTLSQVADTILHEDGSVWVPVETTLLRDGFLAAWAEGARKWREHEPDGRAELINVEEAWSDYEPVAFSVSSQELVAPGAADVGESFEQELHRFISREMAEREADLLTRLENRPSDPRTRNALGVLYARYGRYSDAEEQFLAAIEAQSYVPAIVNLGNIALQNESPDEAARLFRRALDREPDSHIALLGLARAHFQLEEYTVAAAAHAELAQVAPELAERFAYLGSDARSGGRADDATRSRNLYVWEEE